MTQQQLFIGGSYNKIEYYEWQYIDFQFCYFIIFHPSATGSDCMQGTIGEAQKLYKNFEAIFHYFIVMMKRFLFFPEKLPVFL